MVRILFKPIFKYLLILIFIIGGVLFLLSLPWIQLKVSQSLLNVFNHSFNTDLSVEKINITPYGKIEINNFQILDKRKNIMLLIPKIKASINFYKLLINGENIHLKEITLHKAKLYINTYKGENQTNLNEFLNKFISDKKNKSNLFLKGKVSCYDAQIKISNENLSEDKRDIFSSHSLDISIEDFQSKKDQFQIQLSSLKAKGLYQKKFFEIKKLSSLLKITSKDLEAKKVNLETSRSLIRGDLRFYFDQFNDFKSFTHKVKIEGSLKKNSQLAGEDLGLLINRINPKAIIKAQGSIKGIIDKELILSNIQLENGKNLFRSPLISLSQIGSKDHFSIKQKELFLHLSYKSLEGLFPDFIEKNTPTFLKECHEISYKGLLEIKSDLINCKGYLQSPSFKSTELNLIINHYKGSYPTYQGNLSTKEINLFPFIKKDISLKGDLSFKGRFFDIKKLALSLKGQIKNLKSNNYLFQDIQLNGDLTKDSFNGAISIDDPKLKASIKGLFVFSKEKILNKSKINIDKIDLKALRLTKESQYISLSKILINLEGKNINTLYGDILFEQGCYEKEGKKHLFSKGVISSELIDNKNLSIQLDITQMIKAKLKGQFIWKDIALVIKKHLFNLLNKEQTIPFVFSDTAINFDLNIEKNLAAVFFNDIRKNSGIQLKGRLDTNKMVLHSTLEEWESEKLSLKTAQLEINTQENKNLLFSCERFFLYGRKIEGLHISTEKKQKELLIFINGLTTLGDTHQSFSLNLYKEEKNNTAIIGINPSYFFINNHKWEINKDNQKLHLAEIALNTFDVNIKKIDLYSSDQKLSLSAYFKDRKIKFIQGEFDNIQLNKIIPFSNHFNIDGKTIGGFSFDFSENTLKPDIKLTFKDLNLNKLYLGDLKVLTYFNREDKTYSIDVKLSNKNKKLLTIVGKINNHSKKEDRLNLEVDAKDLPLDFMNVLFHETLSQIKGEATGKIKVRGDYTHPELLGAFTLKKGQMKIDYLNACYELIGSPSIEVDSNHFYLKNLLIKDKKYKTQGLLNGQLSHEGLQKWGVSLLINADKLLVIDTTELDNSYFYGKIFNKGDIHVLIDEKQINIKAENSSIIDNSSISILLDKNKDREEESKNFIKYTKKENKTIEDTNSLVENSLKIQENSSRDFFFTLSTQIHSNTNFYLLLDKSSKSYIQSKGQGNITFKIAPKEDILLSGKYIVEEGLFQYSYGELFSILSDKKFNVKKGSIITWTGSPNNPYLEVGAYYKKLVSNINSFLGDDSITKSNALAKLDINLNGEISNPKINVEIDFPDESESVQQAIKRKMDTTDEKFNQFASILILGQFFPNKVISPSPNQPNNNMNDANLENSLLYDFALSKLNNFLAYLPPSFKFNINYSGGRKNPAIRSDIQYQINPRLSIEGSMDFNIGTSNKEDQIPNKNKLETMNLKLDVDLSKRQDMSFNLSIFTKPPYHLGNTSEDNNPFVSQTYGIGFIYNTQFNSFREFIKRKPRKN